MDSPTRGSLRLFQVAGIDVYLHWSWFLVAVLQIQARAGDYQQDAWKVAEYVCLFGIVLLHEFGHSFACRSVGGEASTIVLWPLGGIAYVSPPTRPGAVLWSIVAGPGVNLLLIAPFFTAWYLARVAGWAESFHDAYVFIGFLTQINLGLLIFNLIPLYPLDGGQILFALLWYPLGRWKSLLVVSIFGAALGSLILVCCLGGLFLALISGGGDLALFCLMLGLIAAFIVLRSLVSFGHAQARLAVETLPRREVCSCPECQISPPLGPFWVCEHCETRFDLFEAHGKCPACGAWYLEPACPHCHASSHIDRWLGERGPAPAGQPGEPAHEPERET